jgi:ABC-2 type transport system ATP-binding protein
MIHDPKILILDEPVSGLDPNQIIEIRELIKGLGQKKIVLISSHILQEIQATVSRIIIIHKGEIVADGTSDELISGAQGNTQMTLELMNAGEESIEEMKAVIPSINFGRISEQNGITMVHLEYPTKSDPRKDIFAYAISKDWVILEMTPAKTNLEDIFRKLTLTEAADA